jgi:transposase
MKKQHVELSAEDKKTLEDLLSKGVQKVRVQKRARTLQMLDKGMTYQEVKKHLNVSHISLSKWANLYKTEGLKMLYDKPRSGRPVGLSGEERAKVTALACSTPPEGYAKWSLRLLSDRLVELDIVENISHTEVGRILKKMNFNHIEKNSGVSEN